MELIAKYWAPAVVGLAVSLGGAWLSAWVVTVLPPDFFTREPNGFRERHPVLRVCLLGGKNVIGLALLLIGVPMLLAPGPGMLVVMLGLALIDFPGKRDLIARVLSRPKIRKSVNWIRRKAQRPPLQFPEFRAPQSSARLESRRPLRASSPPQNDV